VATVVILCSATPRCYHIDAAFTDDSSPVTFIAFLHVAWSGQCHCWLHPVAVLLMLMQSPLSLHHCPLIAILIKKPFFICWLLTCIPLHCGVLMPPQLLLLAVNDVDCYCYQMLQTAIDNNDGLSIL